MLQPSAGARSTCSYCCRPFTPEDPAVIVESSIYFLPVTAPVADASQPSCAVVQLAPDVVLCRDCRRQLGYDDADDDGESGTRTPFATAQEEGEASAPREKKRGRNLEPAAAERSLGNWAFAMEYAGAWHLFRKFGCNWRHQGRARGIATGRQENLLRSFAAGGGFLAQVEAVKLLRQTYSAYDSKKIMQIIKPDLSRLRKVIRNNLRISDRGVDPLPRDRYTRGWQASVQIGYASKNDDGRLEFKLLDQLSTDESLDFRA